MRKKRRFVIIKFFLSIPKNICSRKLFIWYHRYRITPFLDCGFESLANCIITYPIRSYLLLGNKKCCIYTVCGVSQTPKIFDYREESSINEEK